MTGTVLTLLLLVALIFAMGLGWGACWIYLKLVRKQESREDEIARLRVLLEHSTSELSEARATSHQRESELTYQLDLAIRRHRLAEDRLEDAGLIQHRSGRE